MTLSTPPGMQAAGAVPPVTEDEIVAFLVNTPEFFERHAEMLTAVQLTGPHGGRAIGLQERQAVMLRDKIKALEQRLMAMVRSGHDNTAIADRLHRWSLALAGTADPADLPVRAVEAAKAEFGVPQAAIRLWDVAAGHRLAGFARDPGPEVRAFAASLGAPYCGPDRGFDAVRLLERPQEALSLALMPLRPDGGDGACFGLLMLASDDAARFDPAMGTDFLQRMGATAAAAMGRLRG